MTTTQAPVRVDLVEGWSISLPPGFARNVEPDGAVVLWNDEIMVRAMSISTIGREDGTAFTARETLGEELGEPFTHPAGNLAVVSEEFEGDIDGERVFTVPVAAPGANVLLSVFFHRRSPGLAGWARARAESLVRETRA